MMFLLAPLLLGLIIYFTITDALASRRRRKRQRFVVFHADGKSDAEIAAEIKQQFAPTKEWC